MTLATLAAKCNLNRQDAFRTSLQVLSTNSRRKLQMELFANPIKHTLKLVSYIYAVYDSTIVHGGDSIVCFETHQEINAQASATPLDYRILDPNLSQRKLWK